MSHTLRAIPKRIMVTRVAMCGGGLSYDVLVLRKYVENYDGVRYTTICRTADQYSDGMYLRLEDAMTPEEHYQMPLGWDRYEDRKAINKAVDPIAYQFALAAFPELAALGKIPFLWANGLFGDGAEFHCDKLLDSAGKVLAEWRYDSDGKPYKFSPEEVTVSSGD